MTFQNFIQKVKKAVQEHYGDRVTVAVQQVLKNNGLELTGLILQKEEESIATTIYLEPFFRDYEEGVTMGELVRKIIQINDEHSGLQKTDILFLTDYEQAKKHLACRLVHLERNQKLLENTPHQERWGLALVCHCILVSDEIGCGSMVIHTDHLRLWGISEEQLFEDALQNMPVILPPERIPLSEYLEEMTDCLVEQNMDAIRRHLDCGMEEEPDLEWIVKQIIKTWIEEKKNAERMCIFTNCRKFFGASILLYPGMLEKMAEEFSEAFYILPSSVHEVILLADTGENLPEELRNLVWTVNRTQVAADEFLTDEVFFYRKGMKEPQKI